jgi:hypothetical protein
MHAARMHGRHRTAAPLEPLLTLLPTGPTLQIALGKADELLDMVVAGEEPSYDAVRARLSDAYREAGLSDVANFISAAT